MKVTYKIILVKYETIYVYRCNENDSDLVSESNLGIESLIIGAATFERSYR